MRPCLAAVVCSLAGFVGACDAPPPPGPPPADDAGTPGPCGGCAPPRVCRTSNVDVEGTCVAPAEEGALCYADDRGDPRVVTLSHACADGLDCARVVEDFPTLQLACGPEGRLDSLCADLSGLTGDDGCAEEYLCSPVSSTCVPVGAVGAPCASDDECEGSVCRDFDFSGDFRCVVDECEAGCGEGLVCRDVEACGRTCVAPAEEGASCGSNLIKEVCNLDHPCAAGLECVVTFEIFDGTTSDCAVPGALGEPCAGLVNAFDSGDDPSTDGCVDGLRCTADGLCADEDALRDAGDDCDDAAQCVSGQCFQGSCT